MSSFTSPLRVEIAQRKRAGRCLALLVEPFRYEVGELGSGDLVEVPVGFETDFASIPRILWSIEPPLGDAGKAAVLHDRLYATAERPRRQADQIFLEAMAVLKVPAWKRWPMFLAVRLVGWRSFGQTAEGGRRRISVRWDRIAILAAAIAAWCGVVQLLRAPL